MQLFIRIFTALSSTMRAIDQLTAISAPVLTGLLMTYGSMVISAVFIAAWNVCSVCVEFSLLHSIYRRVPELSLKLTYSADQNLNNNAGVSEEGDKSPLTDSSKFNSSPSRRYNHRCKYTIVCLYCGYNIISMQCYVRVQGRRYALRREGFAEEEERREIPAGVHS